MMPYSGSLLYRSIPVQELARCTENTPPGTRSYRTVLPEADIHTDNYCTAVLDQDLDL